MILIIIIMIIIIIIILLFLFLPHSGRRRLEDSEESDPLPAVVPCDAVLLRGAYVLHLYSCLSVRVCYYLTECACVCSCTCALLMHS